MKNILIFSSEIGSTKFIYNSIIKYKDINFTFILSNDQNSKQYNDQRFINIKDFNISLIKKFNLGIICLTGSKEGLLLGKLFKKNSIKFGSYIDSWINIEKKCENYRHQIEMIGSFLLVPDLELSEFIKIPLPKNVKIYDVGHSDLESVEINKSLNNSRSGIAIYSQPVSKYFGNTIFNEYDLVEQTINSLNPYDLKLNPINIILHPEENTSKFDRFINKKSNINIVYASEFEKRKVLPKLATLLFTTRLLNTYLQKIPTISLYNGMEISTQRFLESYTIFSKNLAMFDYNINNYLEIFKNIELKKITFLGSKEKFENTMLKLFD